MLPGRVVVSCRAGFRPSAGGSEPSTDKTGSTCHCVVSFVMLGNLLNMAAKNKRPAGVLHFASMAVMAHV